MLAGTHYYKVTVAGTSDATEPTWPTDGTTVVDNEVTWQDLGAYTEPLTAHLRLEDMALVSDVQIGGTLTVIAPISRAYDKTKAWLSSALIFGDLQARATDFFHQASWTSVWQDSRIGSDTTAKYNNVRLSDRREQRGRHQGALAHRVHQSSTTYKVVGETIGQIATGTTDARPACPSTA